MTGSDIAKEEHFIMKIGNDIYYVGVNDHQVEFARNVEKRMGTIILVEDIEELGDVITNYDELVAKMEHGLSSNNTQFNKKLEMLINSIFEGKYNE